MCCLEHVPNNSRECGRRDETRLPWRLLLEHGDGHRRLHYTATLGLVFDLHVTNQCLLEDILSWLSMRGHTAPVKVSCCCLQDKAKCWVLAASAGWDVADRFHLVHLRHVVKWAELLCLTTVPFESASVLYLPLITPWEEPHCGQNFQGAALTSTQTWGASCSYVLCTLQITLSPATTPDLWPDRMCWLTEPRQAEVCQATVSL